MGFLSTKFSSGVFVKREGGECVVVGYQIPCYQIFGEEFPGAGGILDSPPPPRHVSDFRFCPLLRHWECKKSGRNPRKMKQVRVYSYSMLSTSLTKYVLQGNFDLVLQVIKL